MPYSKFTLNEVINQFKLQTTTQNLFEPKKIEIDGYLKEALDYAFELPLRSEKARSELIVMPILLEARKLNSKSFSIFSGESLDIDEELGLNGECDFIISKSDNKFFLNAPIFGLVEALVSQSGTLCEKKQDIDTGLGQCIAQMIGAKIFNEKENNKINTIFGCVTTGEDWQFMKLENSIITFDKKRYYINEVESILGVLHQIINYYK